MKIKALLIAAGLAGLGLASCVQDQYGYGYGGRDYSYGTWRNSDYYDRYTYGGYGFGRHAGDHRWGGWRR